jgi:hypothetical protein
MAKFKWPVGRNWAKHDLGGDQENHTCLDCSNRRKHPVVRGIAMHECWCGKKKRVEGEKGR